MSIGLLPQRQGLIIYARNPPRQPAAAKIGSSATLSRDSGLFGAWSARLFGSAQNPLMRDGFVAK
jgi:hypothetical protein